MTREEAKTEIMQIYGSLSEKKKKALDVAFKAMEQEPCEDDHDGCMDCVYQDNPQDAMPCRECKHNYMDKWKVIPNKEGHWEVMYEPKNMGVCSKCGKCAYLYNNRGSAYCPHCGCAMVEPQESEVSE